MSILRATAYPTVTINNSLVPLMQLECTIINGSNSELLLDVTFQFDSFIDFLPEDCTLIPIDQLLQDIETPIKIAGLEKHFSIEAKRNLLEIIRGKFNAESLSRLLWKYCIEYHDHHSEMILRQIDQVRFNFTQEEIQEMRNDSVRVEY